MSPLPVLALLLAAPAAAATGGPISNARQLTFEGARGRGLFLGGRAADDLPE